MCFLHGLELLSTSCGFDSRWEHQFSGNEDSFIAAFFMQNCNFGDRFVSETRLKIQILSVGMDVCHRFTFSGLSLRGINYNLFWTGFFTRIFQEKTDHFCTDFISTDAAQVNLTYIGILRSTNLLTPEHNSWFDISMMSSRGIFLPSATHLR